MDAPDTIHKLVERFNRNLDDYRSGRYKEAELRSEFINPFFIALGWDVNNEQGWAEAYKEVIHEYSQKIGDSPKAPDYCFRIGGQNKFFVEAKKPVIDIKRDINPAFQLRRYAWSAKLSLSILTDFEEFAVYDCRVKPSKEDKASKARISYIKYTDYIEKWDEIYSVFALEEIRKGSFDRYADTTKKKRGTAEVDDAFLEDIEAWRDVLAKHIILRNSTLTVHQLNRAVQVTIDRIIFLRICEDRGIEPYGQLRDILADGGVYPKLVDLFRNADDRYNSGLFHFQKERGRPEPDSLTPTLKVDDKILRDILGGLYYPDSPYEFSVLPADILGQVYERFLGKVIRLTPGGRAKVEDKPEVRKAGGVYYTPTYIVDYIVEHTIGKLLEKITLKKVEKLRILDPACGSGSFLIGAYQYLLDWHIDYYSKHKPDELARKRKPPIYKTVAGDWKLTTTERKRILLNNIYGVDIDTQAVEVTKLSLLLKVLEDESKANLDNQMRLLHERALPDLSDNIKCGNSLIGTDYLDNTQMSLLDDEESRRINVFDWETEFPDIFKGKNPGFDAVIGNPPYVFTRNEGIDDFSKRYFYNQYHHQSAQLNTFALFLEKSCYISSIGGHIGFITPNNWLTIDSFTSLREFIITHCGSLKIMNILDRVFHAASVDTAIVLFQKHDPTDITVGVIEEQKELFTETVKPEVLLPPEFIIQISLLGDSEARNVMDKITTISKPLREYCTVSTGLKAYQRGKGKPPQNDKMKNNRIYHATRKIDKTYGPYLEGVDVGRYQLGWSGEYISYGNWLAEPRKSIPFEGPRILVRQIPSKPPLSINAVYTDMLLYHDINSMVVFGEKSNIVLKYILGILNSKLLSFWFLKRYDKFQRKIFPQFKVKELAAFPICSIDFSDPLEKAAYDKMVKLVERMLDLHKQLHAKGKTQHEKTVIQRQIAATDKAIDKLVYELYGLTDEEIRIVEGETL